MELSHIKYFLEAASTQHISKSAARLHIAQPALTKSIHNLEKELGVPLFIRKGRNVTLTHYGIYLKDKLSPLMKQFDEITDSVSEMANTENRTIRISVLAASTLVTSGIIEYKKAHPDIHFHVLKNPEDELYDIEITTNLFYNHSTDAENVFVCTENIYLAVPNTEKYKNCDSINLSDFKNEGFISLFASKQLRSICDKFCRHSGFEPEIIFDSDSIDAIKNMIAANLGIGFWPEFSWGEFDNKQIKLLKIANPTCRRDIIITCRNIKADNSNVEDFFNFLKNYFENKKMKERT